MLKCQGRPVSLNDRLIYDITNELIVFKGMKSLIIIRGSSHGSLVCRTSTLQPEGPSSNLNPSPTSNLRHLTEV